MGQDKFCRLCAEERDSFVRIYEEEGQKLNLATKIIQCLQIWLYPEDPLPKTVCIDCCAKLNQYFDFFETTSRAQLSLQIMFDPKMANKAMKKEHEHNSSGEGSRATPGDEEEEEQDNNGAVSPGRNGEDDEDEEAEPPEFVECVLSDKDSTAVQKIEGTAESSASSRRKCRTPVKRGPPPDKEKTLARERANTRERSSARAGGKTRTSVRAPRGPAKERASAQESMPLQQRLQLRDKVSRSRTSKDKEQEKPDDISVLVAAPSVGGLVETKLEVEEVEGEGAFGGISLANTGEDRPGESSATVDWTACNTESIAADKKPKGGRRKRDTKANASGEKPPRPKAVLEGYPWQCTDCTDVLSSLQELRQHHQNVHNQAPNFKCVQCAKTYTRYRSFARHVKLHRNPKKFKCEECGKCFSQKTVLQSHSTVHTDARPHVCPQCGKAFKQFSSLYLHSKCHLPDQIKPKFPCDICHKDFATKHTLETHRKIHTGERNFICDICGKSFIAKGSLDYHILTHSGEKPHHCTVCGKGFKTARLLGKHATLHTGIKPHQCDVCGKQFRERGALREHNRIHTGAMPYTCEFCGKNFRFKGILTVHRRQHTGERPYSCAECRREFTNWANYNKHMKRRHRNPEDPLATNTNRVTTTRTYQPPSGVVPVPTNQLTMRMMPQQTTINNMAVPATVSVSPLGNSYGLAQQHSLGDNSNSSSISPMNHVSVSVPVSMTTAAGMYSSQNHVVKMPNIYGSHTGNSMATTSVANKMSATTSLSNMFHGGTSVVGTTGGTHKMPNLSNVFHPGQQQDSQDSLDRSMERPQHNNPLMGSYHVPSYVPTGLPMGSMGYYIPPIHHTDPSMDMLHNRMTNNQ